MEPYSLETHVLPVLRQERDRLWILVNTGAANVEQYNLYHALAASIQIHEYSIQARTGQTG